MRRTDNQFSKCDNRISLDEIAQPHGEWGKWLEGKVDFSYRQAARFIQVANEFSNVPTLTGLTSSKVYALLDLPSDQREEFISQPQTDG